MESVQHTFANQELQWFGSDTEWLYQHNVDENLEDLHRHNQVNKRFTYKFNCHGFRADEFSPVCPNVLSLGCSHTLGIGVPYESTWTYLVSISLRLKNYNLGVAGASNDTAFRLVNKWIDQLHPEIVIFLSTERTRFELHKQDQIDNISVWNYEWYEHTKEFMRHWYSNDTNGDMNYLKNMLAIKQLCNDRGIKYLHEDFLNIYEKKIFSNDHARDLTHFGEKTHSRVADMFLSRL